MVHSEVVLQGDGGKCLCSFFHLDVLFGFDCLVQAVAPLAAFHYTAGLFVDNLHLAVHHNVLVIPVEHGVSLEQLLQGVYPFALYGVMVQHLVFLVKTLLVSQVFFVFESRQLCGYVWKYEQVFVVYLLCEPVCTLVCKVNGVQFFVNNEIQRLYRLRHLTVVVLHVILFRLEHTGLYAFF